MKARILRRDDILAATAQNVENSERLKHPEERRLGAPCHWPLQLHGVKGGKERTDYSLWSWTRSVRFPTLPPYPLNQLRKLVRTIFRTELAHWFGLR